MKETYVTFESGVGTVTGANFLLEVGETKLLVDCGLLQGEKFAIKENRKDFTYAPADIKYLFITHAHLDHVGRIPKLVKDGFHGMIYSTPQTRELARLILDDAVKLLAREAQADGVLPLYESTDIDQAFTLWRDIPYHEMKSFDEGFGVYLMDAGHILGSSMIQFTIGDKKIVFTGDLGNSPAPLLRDTEKLTDTNYLIMESVYGDRNHEPADVRRTRLQEVIQANTDRGGTLVIPAFSLERTQVILYEINELFEQRKVTEVPVFVDSPLATKVTQIYKNSTQLFNQTALAEIAKGEDIFDFPKLTFTSTVDDSNAIERMKGPKIIIAGSGMSVGGRVIHHEATYLPDANSTILLVGYQSLGTIGRQIQNGAKHVTINGVSVAVKAHVENILGYSAHKDSDHLVAFVADTAKTLKKAFVVMGEPKASLFLAQRLREYVGVDTIYPERGLRYLLN